MRHLVWMSLVACGMPDAKGVSEDTAVDFTEDLQCEFLTYSTAGQPFLTTWCRACHSVDLEGDERQGAPAGIDFNVHADAVRFEDRIVARALGEVADMPPLGGPSVMEQVGFSDWIACGLPP